jgi:hypothetical protein
MGYNIFEDRPQLVRAVILYLNMNFGNLKPKTHLKIPKSVFYVNSDNEILMEYDTHHNILWNHKIRIWLKIESLFPIHREEFNLIMKQWWKDSYNMKHLREFSTCHSEFRWIRLRFLS